MWPVIIREVKSKGRTKTYRLVPPLIEEVLDPDFDYSRYLNDLMAYENGKPQGYFKNADDEYRKAFADYMKIYFREEEPEKGDELFGKCNDDICILQHIFEDEWQKHHDDPQYMENVNKFITSQMKLLANNYLKESKANEKKKEAEDISKKEINDVPNAKEIKTKEDPLADTSINEINTEENTGVEETNTKKDAKENTTKADENIQEGMGTEEDNPKDLLELAEQHRLEEFRKGNIKWEDMPMIEVYNNRRVLNPEQRRRFIKIFHYLFLAYGNSDYFIPDDFERYSWRQLFGLNQGKKEPQKGGKKK